MRDEENMKSVSDSGNISIGPFENKLFSSPPRVRNPLSGDQKWFLRPCFPLMGGLFGVKSGLRFLGTKFLS